MARQYIPTVNLLHEFAAYTRPSGAFLDAILRAGVTVFSSELTRENTENNHLELQEIKCEVIPQGRCLLPEADTNDFFTDHVKDKLRPKHFPQNGIIVLGLGTVQLRKGVDLFLDCAARVVRMAPELPIRFIWIGKGYDSCQDLQYSVYLNDQIHRAEIFDRVCFIDEVEDLKEIYDAVDIFLLSSRLDPLPNVAIDTLSQGLPVLCFEHSTGIASILKEHGLADYCVAPFLDTAKMTQQLIQLASSVTLRQQLKENIKQFSLKIFNMSQYVKSLVYLSELQRIHSQQQRLDVVTIAESNSLQLGYALPFNINSNTPDESALLYIKNWSSGLYRRKPFPGFHPGIYTEHRAEIENHTNPVADYIRKGFPQGPWRFPLVTANSPLEFLSQQRVALHIHAFYPTEIIPILIALKQNKVPIDLLISVTTEADKSTVMQLVKSGHRGGEIDIQVMPNKGRDLGAFLTGFSEKILQQYDFVGHFHTKSSPTVDKAQVKKWIDFIFANLLGGKLCMADRIMTAMIKDEHLGMVFADDPHVISWGKNRLDAENLAQRLQLPCLPKEITFPVGSMFWARVSALTPLLKFGFAWEDYPQEPLPYDGTMLHALERLLPMVVTSSGYTVAVTHVAGVTQ